MTDLTILPTAKFIKAGTILAAVVVVGLDIAYLVLGNGAVGHWVMAVPVLLMVWPASRALRRKLTKTTVTGDRLRYETGVATKSTRNIQLSKVQDVRVDQTLFQRLLNVGNISIETAGEASRLTIHNVDDPQALADEIMNRAQRGTASA